MRRDDRDADVPGLGFQSINLALHELRVQRERRKGLRPERKQNRPQRSKAGGMKRLHDAFQRAELERAELARLRAQYPRYSGLYFKRDDSDSSTASTAD